MFLNSMYNSIASLTKHFAKHFRLCASTESYLQFATCSASANANAYITIIRSSYHGYRVIAYYNIFNVKKYAEYQYFDSLLEMCSYLDTLSSLLV